MRTESRRQKRRTSKHHKRRNRSDEDEIRAWGSDNVNNRAIAVRLHAQMIYNNNNNNKKKKPLSIVTHRGPPRHALLLRIVSLPSLATFPKETLGR